MQKYGGSTMADIASYVISDRLVKHLLSPLEKSINCSYIHKMSCGRRVVKWHKHGEIFNHLYTQQQNIAR